MHERAADSTARPLLLPQKGGSVLVSRSGTELDQRVVEYAGRASEIIELHRFGNSVNSQSTRDASAKSSLASCVVCVLQSFWNSCSCLSQSLLKSVATFTACKQRGIVENQQQRRSSKSRGGCAYVRDGGGSQAFASPPRYALDRSLPRDTRYSSSAQQRGGCYRRSRVLRQEVEHG